MPRINESGGLKAIFPDNAEKSTAQQSLSTAFTRKVGQIIHTRKNTALSLSIGTTTHAPDKKLSTRAVRHSASDNTGLSCSAGNPANQASPQKQAMYQRYERAAQHLTDVTSMQRFKKDLFMGYGAGNISAAQFSKLSSKVTSAVFRLVRQGQGATLSLRVLEPLVGDDKAREIMKNVDTQQVTRLNAIKWGAVQNPGQLYQTLSDKSHKLNSFREAIDFKRELLVRTTAKELPPNKFQKLHTDALVPALKKLSQKPEQARQMTYKRLELLVGSSQATEILKMCRRALQKSDQQLSRSLENLPAPPTDDTPPTK